MSFGNYRINFTKVKDVPIGEVFGTRDLEPSEMTSLLWHFIKAEGLEKR
jgi:hypothetical protein